MEHVIPDSYRAKLIEQIGEKKANFICEQWSKTATGTSSFPRFDPVKLTFCTEKNIEQSNNTDQG